MPQSRDSNNAGDHHRCNLQMFQFQLGLFLGTNLLMDPPCWSIASSLDCKIQGLFLCKLLRAGGDGEASYLLDPRYVKVHPLSRFKLLCCCCLWPQVMLGQRHEKHSLSETAACKDTTYPLATERQALHGRGFRRNSFDESISTGKVALTANRKVKQSRPASLWLPTLQGPALFLPARPW